MWGSGKPCLQWPRWSSGLWRHRGEWEESSQLLPSEELTLASSKICSKESHGIRPWRKEGPRKQVSIYGSPPQNNKKKSLQRVEARTGRAGRNTEALSEHSRVKWGKLKPKWNFICSEMSKTTRRATVSTLLTKIPEKMWTHWPQHRGHGDTGHKKEWGLECLVLLQPLVAESTFRIPGPWEKGERVDQGRCTLGGKDQVREYLCKLSI